MRRAKWGANKLMLAALAGVTMGLLSSNAQATLRFTVDTTQMRTGATGAGTAIVGTTVTAGVGTMIPVFVSVAAGGNPNDAFAYGARNRLTGPSVGGAGVSFNLASIANPAGLYPSTFLVDNGGFAANGPPLAGGTEIASGHSLGAPPDFAPAGATEFMFFLRLNIPAAAVNGVYTVDFFDSAPGDNIYQQTGGNFMPLFTSAQFTVVPEPSTIVLSLVGVTGGLGAWLVRRRKAAKVAIEA